MTNAHLEKYLPTLHEVFSDNLQIFSFDPLGKGMTNDSHVLDCSAGKFILRIPGKGSEALIDRTQEHEVYTLLEGRGIADEVLSFDRDSGLKITRYIEGARVCDAHSESDVRGCVRVLKDFHNLRLEVDHYFDPWERLEYYESLRGGQPSEYADYEQTKEAVRVLYEWVQEQPRDTVLAHIDPVSDNFLFTPDGKVLLIDWEYAAMQDKDIDVAMFAVYSLLDKQEIDRLIEIYQDGATDSLQKKKIYAYISIMGLVWSNWSEFQKISGQDLGEYALGQYRFAKEYHRYFHEMG